MFKKTLSLFILILVIAATASAQYSIVRTEFGAPGDSMAFQTVNIGDWNLDGIDDYAVSKSNYDIPATNAGRVEVRSGVDGTMIAAFGGTTTNEFFGISVANAGDVNGDGQTDLLVGASGYASFEGAAFVYSGTDHSLIHFFTTSTAGNQTGWAVSGTGDVNNDGFDDFIVGSPPATQSVTSEGRVQVLSGANLSILHDVSGGSSNERLGQDVGGGFDIDNDGMPDFMASGNSMANIYSGATGAILYSYGLGNTPAIFGIPDINRDGHDDFAYLGSSIPHPILSIRSGANASEIWRLEIPGAATGQAQIVSVGDVDKDGHNDLMLGTMNENFGGIFHAGAMRLISIATGQIRHVEGGINANDRLGSSVGSLGDVNGDGLEDLFLGAVGDDAGGSGAGSLTISNWEPNKTGLPLPHFETFDQLAANAPGATPSELELPQGWLSPFALAENSAVEGHWNVSTGQFSSVAGPVSDSTATSASMGNYLHIDDNGNEDFIEMLSPFLNFSTFTAPRLDFHLHSHNQELGIPFVSQNHLSIDVLDVETDSYTLNVFGPVGHESNDGWILRNVDLSAFAGKIIRLRFRADTLNLGAIANTHNIAIDDVAIYDAVEHAGGQVARPGLARFELGDTDTSLWSNHGVGIQSSTTLSHGDVLRFSFEGQPNQGLMCFFGARNPGHTSFGAVGQVDCGFPDTNFDSLPEGLFLVGDGLNPVDFLDLLFNTGPAGSNFIDFPIPTALPPGEVTTFQCLFGSDMGVRLSNAATLFIN